MTDPNAPTHSIQPGFVSNESNIPEPFVGSPADATNPVSKMVAPTTGQGIIFHASSSEPVTVWLPTDESLDHYWRIGFQPEPGKEFRGRNIDVMDRENGHVDLLFLVSEFVDGTYLRRRLFVANDVEPLNDPNHWMTLFNEPMLEIPLPENFQAEWVKWSVKVEQGAQRAFMLNGTPSESSAGSWYWGGPYGASAAYELTNIDSTVTDAHIVTPGALEDPEPGLGVTEGFYTAKIRGGTDFRQIFFHSLVLDPAGSVPIHFQTRPIYGPDAPSYYWPELADLIVDTDPAKVAMNGTTLMVTTANSFGNDAASYQIDPDIQVSRGTAPPFTQPGQWISGLSEVVEGVRFGAYVTSVAGNERVEWLFDTANNNSTGHRVLRQRRRAAGETYATQSLLIDDIRADDDWATCVCTGPAMSADTVQLVITGADGAMTLHFHDNASGQWQQRDIVGKSFQPVVYIEARTELMPNHLPGQRNNTAGNASVSKMVPSSAGQSIIFHTTNATTEPITTWLPTDKTFNNFSRIVFQREPDRLLSGISMDAIERKNGNVDLVFLVAEYIGGVYTRQRLFVSNDFTPVQDPEAWILHFDVQMEEITLPADFSARHVEWSVRVEGSSKRDFMLAGNQTGPQGARFYWCGPKPSSPDYGMWSMDSVIGDGKIIALGALPTELPSVGGFYVARDHGNAHSALDFYTVKRNPHHVSGNPFITQRWPIHGPENGVWPRINNLITNTGPAYELETGTTLLVTTLEAEGRTGPVFRLDPYEQLGQGQPPRFTDPDERIPGIREITSGPRFGAYVTTGQGNERIEWLFDAAELEGTNDHVIRLRSRDAEQTFAKPYLLAGGLRRDDDWATCVCTNPDLGTDVVHLVATDRDGSVTLYFQDGISGLWQQRSLIDSDLTEQVEVQTYTTNINVFDETWAPLGAHRLAITSEYPTSIQVNGRSFHTSKVLPVEVSTSAQGTLEIISPVQHLGVPKFTLHPVAEDALERANSGDLSDLAVAVVPTFDDFPVDPNQVLIDRLDTYNTGEKIRNARKSNGKPLFPDDEHRPSLENCDTAANHLQDLVAAHAELTSVDPAVLAMDHRRPYANPVPVLSRTVYRLGADGNWSFSVHDGSEPISLGGQPLAAFAGVGDGTVWSAVGDLFNYLWEGIKQGIQVIELAIEKLGNGLRKLVVKIGNLVYSAVLAVASAIADAADWVLQHTLGITLEQLRQWLGFIFDWDDILENHAVIKHLITLFAGYAKTQAGIIKNNFGDYAAALEPSVTMMPDPPTHGEGAAVLSRQGDEGVKDNTSVGTASRAPNAQLGTKTLFHYSEHGDAKDASLPFGPTFLNPLADAMEEAATSVGDHFDHLDASKFGTDDFGTVLQSLETLLEQLLFDVAKPIGSATLEIGVEAIEGLLTYMDARIDIPVLTPLYENVIAPGSTLSILDVFCLVAAIGATIVSKLANGSDLFSAEEKQAILAAGSLEQWIANLQEEPGQAAGNVVPVPEGVKIAVKMQFLLGAFSVVTAGSYALNYYLRAAGESSLPLFSLIGGCAQMIATLSYASSYIVLRALGIQEIGTLTALFGALYFGRIMVTCADLIGSISGIMTEPIPEKYTYNLWIIEQIVGVFAFTLDIRVAALIDTEAVPEGTDAETFRAIQGLGTTNQFLLSIAQCLTAPIKLTTGTPNQALCFVRAVLNSVRGVTTMVAIGEQNNLVTKDQWVPGYLAN